MSKRSPTTKDIGLLRQLFRDGQLVLAPAFQRNSVWPGPAKAYLIDTILRDKPIPILFFQRTTSAQTGRSEYHVIDGQQRLRAIFEFIEGRFRLGNSENQKWKGRRFSALHPDDQQKILNYDLIVEELSGYTDDDIRDMFLRMNKYVVKLSPQEMRNARYEGKFRDFVERLAKWPEWRQLNVFSKAQIARMRPAEFVAELTILLIEGPQDKKQAVDLYYGEYRGRFEAGAAVEHKLRSYLEWIPSAVPTFAQTRFRKPVDLYALIGALDDISMESKKLKVMNKAVVRDRLLTFEQATLRRDPTGQAAQYVAAASRQTDNLKPRLTRIEILTDVLAK